MNELEEKHQNINFNICIATVNGTGSQKANVIFSKALMRSSFFITPKNLFPSNIQGAPTWFYLRLSREHHLGFKKECDILINLNKASLKNDLRLLKKGGRLIVEENENLEIYGDLSSTQIIRIPFSQLTDKSTDSAKKKKYLKNVIYVGFLSYLFGLSKQNVENLIESEFEQNESLKVDNLKAFQLGYLWGETSQITPLLKIENQPSPNKILIDGNSASALGCFFARAKFASWYPITPSSSLVEEFIRLNELYSVKNGKRDFAVIQAEDEIASICMAIGAGWNGARAFTATSGPGLSLMQEAAGFAYYAEIPLVIFDVQRVGPSTGLPTRSAQSDLFSAAFASHGDTKFPLLLPGNPAEAFEFSYLAFDLAEYLQILIFVMSDLDIGMNLWVTDPLCVSSKPINRGKIADKNYLETLAAKNEVYTRYSDPDGDGISYRALPANENLSTAYLVRGSGHDYRAMYTEDPQAYSFVVDKIKRKIDSARKLLPEPIIENSSLNSNLNSNLSSKVGFVYYGSSTNAMNELKLLLLENNISMDFMRIRSWPFHEKVKEFIHQHDKVFVLDLNLDSQMTSLLKMDDTITKHKFITIQHFGGEPVQADLCLKDILNELSKVEKHV